MKVFDCERCGYSTKHKHDMKRHFTTKKICKSTNDNAPSQSELLLQLYPVKEDSKIFPCECGKKYLYCSALSRHKKNCTTYQDNLLLTVMKKIKLDYNNTKSIVNRDDVRLEKLYNFKDTCFQVKYF